MPKLIITFAVVLVLTAGTPDTLAKSSRQITPLRSTAQDVAEQNKDNPPFGTDPLKLFEAIDSRGGYNYSTRDGINTVNSNLQYSNAAVLLLPPSSFGTGRWPGRIEYIANEIAVAAFHETFHLAGRNRQYSDQVLARATLDIAAARGWRLPSEADTQTILSDRFAASSYWGGILRSKCKPSSERRR